jgi:hypothetical protein
LGSPNRNPLAIALRNGERRKLKHLSTGRKRKRNVMSLVLAKERDTVQTEALTGNVVFGLTITSRTSTRSLLERSTKQGDSPVLSISKERVSSRVSGVGYPS